MAASIRSAVKEADSRAICAGRPCSLYSVDGGSVLLWTAQTVSPSVDLDQVSNLRCFIDPVTGNQ